MAQSAHEARPCVHRLLACVTQHESPATSDPHSGEGAGVPSAYKGPNAHCVMLAMPPKGIGLKRVGWFSCTVHQCAGVLRAKALSRSVLQNLSLSPA